MRVYALLLLLFPFGGFSQNCAVTVVSRNMTTGAIIGKQSDKVCIRYVNHGDSMLYIWFDDQIMDSVFIERTAATDSSVVLETVSPKLPDLRLRFEFLSDGTRMMSTSNISDVVTEYIGVSYRWWPTPQIDQLSESEAPVLITLMIVHAEGNSKGFIVDSDTEDTVACNDLEKNPDIRFFIEHLSGDLFNVFYKYRDSPDFLVEEMRLYTVDDFWTVALNPVMFPEVPDNEFMLRHSMPASTDERDVVRPCRTDKGKLVYIF